MTRKDRFAIELPNGKLLTRDGDTLTFTTRESAENYLANKRARLAAGITDPKFGPPEDYKVVEL